MVDERLKDLRGPGRRQFLRWAATAAAALGVDRGRFLNIINDTAGTAAADTSAALSTALHIGIIDGNGGLSNWTQIFPYDKVIKGVDPNYAHYALGKGIPSTGYDNPYTYAPDSPWQDGAWKITAFCAGNNETHTGNPVTSTTLGSNGMLAASAAIQQANPTLLPILAVGGKAIGSAAGAPAVAAVGQSTQLVDLFNSAASKALLMSSENGSLNEAYYKAFLGLNAAAGRSTTAKGYATGKTSINLLAKNLASQLTPSLAEQTMLGVSSAAPPAISNMGNGMITALKAFSMGLASMLVLPAFGDDPHGLFAGGDAAAAAKAKAMGTMMQGLYTLAKSLPDPSGSGKTVADNMVITISGDTMKNGSNRNGWGDGTAQGHNLLYVMGNGLLKTGWIGDYDPVANMASGWDQATGAVNGSYAGRGTELGASASAAALYAVSKGDMRRVQDFYTGAAIDGVVNLNVTGS